MFIWVSLQLPNIQTRRFRERLFERFDHMTDDYPYRSKTSAINFINSGIDWRSCFELFVQIIVFTILYYIQYKAEYVRTGHNLYTIKKKENRVQLEWPFYLCPIPSFYLKWNVLVYRQAINQTWAYCERPGDIKVKIRLKEVERGNSERTL